MIYLLLSIVCSTALVVIFKYYDKYDVPVFQAIIVNYLVCGIIGIGLQGNLNFLSDFLHDKAFLFAVIMGFLFIFIFTITGIAAKLLGVTVTAVAQKVAFIIPVCGAIFFLQEQISFIKILGIIMAICSIYFLSLNAEKRASQHRFVVFLPVAVFIGSGSCDLILKWVQHHYLSEANYHAFTTSIFLVAGLLGLLFFSMNNINTRKTFIRKSIIGGIALGIPNYGSLYFLILALETSKWQSSVIFPVNNVGIVLLATVSAYILFQEQFGKNKTIGLLLALTSILFIGFIA